MALKRSPSLNYERLHTFVANEDLSGKVYTFVKIVAEGKIENVDTAGAMTVGVLIHGAVKDKACEVLTEPGARVILKLGAAAGKAALPAGTFLKADASGAAVAEATADDATTLFHAVVVGEGLAAGGTAAAANAHAGKFVEAIFMPNTSNITT